jgi:hypothetical protein
VRGRFGALDLVFHMVGHFLYCGKPCAKLDSLSMTKLSQPLYCKLAILWENIEIVQTSMTASVPAIILIYASIECNIGTSFGEFRQTL